MAGSDFRIGDSAAPSLGKSPPIGSCLWLQQAQHCSSLERGQTVSLLQINCPLGVAINSFLDSPNTCYDSIPI